MGNNITRASESTERNFDQRPTTAENRGSRPAMRGTEHTNAPAKLQDLMTIKKRITSSVQVAPTLSKFFNPNHGKAPSAALEPRYDFSNATHVEPLGDKNVVFGMTLEGRALAVKLNVSDEEKNLTRIAQSMGMPVPRSRPLEQEEIDSLRSLLPTRARRHTSGIVMERVQGENLAMLRGSLLDDPLKKMGADPENASPDQVAKAKAKVNRTIEKFFDNEAVLKSIGRSVAFQALTGSTDRWPMPISTGIDDVSRKGNGENIMLDVAKNRLYDIDPTPRPVNEAYESAVAAKLRDDLRSPQGGQTIMGVARFIASEHNAGYALNDRQVRTIAEGFRGVFKELSQRPLSDSDKTQASINRIAKAVGYP